MRNKSSRTYWNYRVGGQVIEQNLLWSRSRRSIPIEQIKNIMKEKGLSQADIADRLSITNASVSRLLSGNQNITLDTLHKLVDAIEGVVEISVVG